MTLQRNMDLYHHLLEIGAATNGHSVVSRLLAILQILPTQHAGAREIWTEFHRSKPKQA